jgi:protein XagA
MEAGVLRRGVKWGLGLGLLLSPSAALAGAWTLPANTGQASVTATMSSASAAFDTSGVVQPTPRYNKFELQGWLEYGLTDRFTGILAPGLQHVDIAAPTDASRTGLGYAEFGGRYSLFQGQSWVTSGQVTLRVPGTNDTSNPAAIGYTDVETDVRGLFGANFAFYGMPAFVDVEIAQRFRAGAPPNEFRGDFTFGVQPAERWLLLAQSFNVISEGPGSPPFASYQYYKLQLSAVYAFTKSWSMQFGGFTTYAGRNALQENGLVLGAGYRF